MTSDKQSLKNTELNEVVGSGEYYITTEHVDDGFMPNTNAMAGVKCPKCGSYDIWVKQGFLCLKSNESYWCHNCHWKFDYGEISISGASSSW